jgi:hypothetical protein
MEILELEVFRKYLGEKYTIGRFSVDGRVICDTLEDKVRELHDINHDGDFTDPGEGKIFAETAIPCGRYKVEMIWWSKHKRMIPHLIGVPGFTGILIHGVATEQDTQGCIGVGENKIKGRLVNGPFWSVTIANLITEAIKSGKEVYITIKQ